MISSTFTDLREHRAALIKAINGQDLKHVAMEDDSAKAGVDVIDSSLQMVRKATGYVLLIGRKYGQTPLSPDRNPGELSITELEFNEALTLNRPILLFLMGDNHLVHWFDVEPDPAKTAKLNAFRERAKRIGPDSQVHRVYATFDSAEDFAVKATQAIADLRRFLDEKAAPIIQQQHVAPAPIPHDLPPKAKKFFGRQDHLETLIQRLRARENTAVVGDAGMGKTALAAEALRAVVGETSKSLAESPYPAGVAYLDLYAMHGAAETAWGTLANKLAGADFMERSPARDRAENACHSRNLLLVIEGAEEADGKDGRPAISELLRVLSPPNRWLILTRLKTQALPSESLILDEALPPADAAALFDSLTLGRVKAEARRQTLDLLAGHPLALTWAGNLLGMGDESPEYLVADWSAAQLPGLNDPREAQHTLAWLFERSVRRLDEAATKALEAAGLLAHVALPVPAIAAALDDVPDQKATRQALKTLVQRGLLRLVDGDQRQFTHVLGYRFARRETGSDPELRARLAVWLHGELSQALAVGATGEAAITPLLEHLGALLRADDDQSLWIPLVQDVLYNFSNRLTDLGRLGQVRLSLDAVAAWLDRFPPDRAQEPYWLRERYALKVLQGNVLRDQGDLAGALTSYRHSFELIRRLAEADPSKAAWQRDLSVSQEKIGDVLRDQGDLTGALASYRQSLEVIGRLAEADPSNAGWQCDLSISYERVGDVLRYQGDLAAALASYQRSLDAIRPPATCDPSNAIWQRQLSVSYNKVGDALHEQGDLAGALASYRQSLEVRRPLAEADPSSAGWQRDLSVSHERMGDVLRDQGDLAGALASYRQSLEVRLRLAEADPSNAGWQRDLSVSYNKIGDVLRAEGDLAGALASCRESLEVSRRLAEADPSNAGWQRDLSYSLTVMAQLYVQKGDHAEALRFAQESLRIDERLAALDPTHATWQNDLKFSRALVARLGG